MSNSLKLRYKVVHFVALCLCFCVCVLLDVGLAFLLFTSLNMIITNTKEDHFIIRGLPNIDLQIFHFNTLYIQTTETERRRKSYWISVACLLLFDIRLGLFVISSKVKTNNTWLGIHHTLTS